MYGLITLHAPVLDCILIRRFSAAPKAKPKVLPAFCFASNPGKRWTEGFFLLYSPFWILWALGILVPFKLYEVCRIDQPPPFVLTLQMVMKIGRSFRCQRTA